MPNIAVVGWDDASIQQFADVAKASPFEVSSASPSNPQADLVIWNLDRYGYPIESLLERMRHQDPYRAVVLAWETVPPTEQLLTAFRSGALDAVPRFSQCLPYVLDRVSAFLSQRAHAESDSALIERLVDKNYIVSLINELLNSLNISRSPQHLQELATPYLVDLSSAQSAHLIFFGKDTVAGYLTDQGFTGEVIATLEAHHGRKFFSEYPGMPGQYVAQFPLLANSQVLGAMVLVGKHPMLNQLKACIQVIGALCGQIGMTLANLQYLEEIERLATHDMLTGLYNRNQLRRELYAEFDRFRRYRRNFSLVMMDIDHFKVINDTYGHQVGDAVLSEVGSLIQKLSRTADTAARFGGEEFILILPETPLEKAAIAAERIRAAMATLDIHALDGRSIGKVSASFGVTESAVSDDDPQQILQRADEAMYQAKRQGRDQVTVLPSRVEDPAEAAWVAPSSL